MRMLKKLDTDVKSSITSDTLSYHKESTDFSVCQWKKKYLQNKMGQISQHGTCLKTEIINLFQLPTLQWTRTTTEFTSKASLVFVAPFPVGVYVCVLSGFSTKHGDLYLVPLSWYMIRLILILLLIEKWASILSLDDAHIYMYNQYTV